MATNKRIQTTELDFDGIKQSLKTYLQGQDQFSDYDFEGSGLSILLDILAYNTHYNALYTNLAINEAFLDSASKRSSVVSKAKELGYVPGSSRSATAVVNVTMINSQLSAPESIDIPRYTPFTTSVNGVSYTFFNTESQVAYRVDNQYVFNDVTLKEGTQLVYRYVIEADTRIVIPNTGVDTSTIRVTVQENAQSSTYSVYVESATLLNVDGDSKVYFIKENENQLYEIEFGNDIVGKKLDQGNVVTVEYIVCNQSAPNGARTFQYNGSLSSSTTAFVVTTTPAFGGSEAESLNSIKWNAPRAYTTQNRAVTLEDYKTIVYSLYPNARSINVWGGEDNNPPTYGDVFISIRPDSAETLSDGEKEYILNDVLGPRRIVTIHPKFVDPSYLYVQLNSTFYYNKSETNLSVGDLSARVLQSIDRYDEDNLNRFESVLKYSNLSTAIDQSDQSIKSSITTLKIHKEIIPQYNQLVNYTVDLGNPIFNAGGPEESIVSSALSVLNVPQTSYIDDLPTGGDTGVLRLFYYAGSQKVVVKNIGTVVYSKGLININDLIITGVPDVSFKLVIKPSSNDIVSSKNQIVSIRPDLATITGVAETDANTYRFTTSRN